VLAIQKPVFQRHVRSLSDEENVNSYSQFLYNTRPSFTSGFNWGSYWLFFKTHESSYR